MVVEHCACLPNGWLRSLPYDSKQYLSVVCGKLPTFFYLIQEIDVGVSALAILEDHFNQHLHRWVLNTFFSFGCLYFHFNFAELLLFFNCLSDVIGNA